MAPYDWYREFFKKKVLPSLLLEMVDCAGSLEGDHADFYTWLKEDNLALFEEITLQKEKLDDIWIKKGNPELFKESCRAWVYAHLRAKPQYLDAKSQPQRDLLFKGDA